MPKCAINIIFQVYVQRLPNFEKYCVRNALMFVKTAVPVVIVCFRSNRVMIWLHGIVVARGTFFNVVTRSSLDCSTCCFIQGICCSYNGTSCQTYHKTYRVYSLVFEIWVTCNFLWHLVQLTEAEAQRSRIYTFSFSAFVRVHVKRSRIGGNCEWRVRLAAWTIPLSSLV